jgi:hypothetical protein
VIRPGLRSKHQTATIVRERRRHFNIKRLRGEISSFMQIS